MLDGTLRTVVSIEYLFPSFRIIRCVKPVVVKSCLLRSTFCVIFRVSFGVSLETCIVVRLPCFTR